MFHWIDTWNLCANRIETDTDLKAFQEESVQNEQATYVQRRQEMVVVFCWIVVFMFVGLVWT